MSALRTFVGIVVLAVILYSVYVWISRNPSQPGLAPSWPTAQQGAGQPAPAMQPATSPSAPALPGFASATSSYSPATPSVPGVSVAMSGSAPANPTSGPAGYPTTNTGAASPASSAPGTPSAPGSALDTLRGYFSRSTPPPNNAPPAGNPAPAVGSPAGVNPAAANSATTGAAATPVNPFGAAPGFASAISSPPSGTGVRSTLAPTIPAIPSPVSNAAMSGTATVVPAQPVSTSNPLATKAPSTGPTSSLGTVLTPGATVPTGILSPKTNDTAGSTAAGSEVASVRPASATAPVAGEDFRTLLLSIQAKLDAGQLSEAHVALSKFYQHPRLSDEENRQVMGLLDQVAGTVVYSRQHYLEPAYRVQPGDTLERVATLYNVSPELLGKINGIRDPESLTPGTELKVVRGPFDAVVDLGRHQLTIMLHDRYAGRFPIGIGRDQPVIDGTYIVRDKKTNPSYYGTDRMISPGDPTNPYGDRMLDLGGRLAIHGTDNAQNIGRSDARGTICLGTRDIHDVYDILSVGSRVTICR